ncbi:ISL3 family transposase, partial [Auritidibacter sp. NML120636]|uniref:ISL3 family transposase n=2 Tax=Auritidibacter TaxID=1160973 RepID=UPI000D727D7A
MSKLTFSSPDLTTFCRLDSLDLTCIGRHITGHKAILECQPNTADDWCRRCGGHGIVRDTVVRRLAHEPFGHRPTTLHIRLRRYKCVECGRVWRQNTTAAAPPRAKISRTGLDWALRALVIDHDTVSVIARKLAVSWHTANSAILAQGHRLLIDDPARFDGVSVIGVDEHVWRHTRRGDKYVTVIIDLTPISQKAGPARLLDMVPGRSKQVFKQWLKARPKDWRDGIDVVAMDGFSGFKTASVEELPEAVEVMDPFHVVKLAGDALDEVRRRIQQETTGHRGRATDPLYRARRTLHTGADLLTAKQQERIVDLFADANFTAVEVTWAVYQDIVRAYRTNDGNEGKKLLQTVIDDLTTNLPTGLAELKRLGRTLKRRAADILAFFTRPGTSNGPTEAINGRLE